MRSLKLLFILLLAFGTPVRAEASPPAALTCFEIVRNRSTQENDDKCVAMAGPLAANKSGKLVLRMDNGERKVFENKVPDDTAYGYALMDFYPATHIFVVGDMGDGGATFQAIDGRTGRVTDFGQSQPHYAPHGAWILLDTDTEDENGGTVTTFSIVEGRGDKPKPVWTSKGDATTLPSDAEFVAWRDDAHVELALPNGFHVMLTQTGDGPWHYDLAALPKTPAKAPVESEEKRSAAPTSSPPPPSPPPR